MNRSLRVETFLLGNQPLGTLVKEPKSSEKSFQAVVASLIAEKNQLECVEIENSNETGIDLISMLIKLLETEDVQEEKVLDEYILENEEIDVAEQIIINEQIMDSLEDYIDQTFPDWETRLDIVFDWLTNEIKLPIENIAREDDLLTKTNSLLIILNSLEVSNFRHIPKDDFMQIISISKEIQKLPLLIPLKLTEMEQINEINQQLQNLLSHLRQLEKTQRIPVLAPNQNSSNLKNGDNPLKPTSSNFYPHLLVHSRDLTLKQKLTSNKIDSPTLIQGNSFFETATLNIPFQEQGTELRTFMREFVNVIARSTFQQTPNTSKLLIRLYPEQLGTIRVELLQKEGVLTLRILTSTSTVKEMMESQLHFLRTALHSQNIEFEQIEVTYTDNHLFQYSENKERQDQPTHDRRKEQQRKEAVEETIQFADTLETVLFESEV